MRVFLKFIAVAVIFTFVVALGANFFATNKSDLEKDQKATKTFTEIKVPPPPSPKNEPPPPPETARIAASLLQELTPETSQSTPDFGGIGFGSGGGGPAIGGQGGFGSDTANLVKAASNANRPPKAVVKVPPEFPLEARTRGVTGYVTLKIFVANNGSIEDVKVEDSEPRGYFEQAALKVVRTWRFEPALNEGRAVAAWTLQKLKFELN